MADAFKAARGVFAAVVTPLDDRLEPDLTLFIEHCRWLLENGCDGLAPLGTTGEANSLSVDQRHRIIDALAESDLPLERMIVGGGSCALADAARLSARITEAGAGGVLLLPPFYYKNPSDDGLFKFYSEVIERVSDDRLALFLYHYPNMSSVPISVDLVGRLRSRYGAVVRGLKDSAGDWDYTAHLLSEHPGLLVFSGSEKFLLKNLRAGGPGCISATTNVTYRAAHVLYSRWTSPDAERLQAELSQIRGLLEQFPLLAAVKEVLAHLSGVPSWRILLPPNAPLSDQQRIQLISSVKNLALR